MLAIIVVLAFALVAVIIYGFRQKKVIEKLKKMVIYDPLTRIFNRGYLDVEFLRIIREIRRRFKDAGKRKLKPLSFVMIDFDGLKSINDTCGHPVGDAFIISIANTLTAAIHRANDILARYGGDEFSVILPETNPLAVQEIAEKMRLSVENAKVENKAGPESITISLGVVTVTDFTGCENIDADEIVKAIIAHADSLLYEVKNMGGDRVIAKSMTLQEILA